MSDIRESIDTAVTQAFSESGDMVTRWVLAAEVIDTDGQRALWTMAAPDMCAWDILGMLTFSSQREQAKAVWDHDAEVGEE